ncbi:hypothetical protein A0H81_02926 [Grifola frondosa]|uniref:Uncharacterized protein n=1 Tax=Grifola frondosa TaxID=5627 RepID=A0A1C7MJR2_GRIFR|nr:hypothetical protein A0H81_02926 [Grifola frondosa]
MMSRIIDRPTLSTRFHHGRSAQNRKRLCDHHDPGPNSEWHFPMGVDNYTVFRLEIARGGRREWRWPTLVYLLNRCATLATVVCEFVGLNLKSKFNCDYWVHSILSLGYIAIGLSSILLALRVMAVWNRNLSVVVLITALLMINMAVSTYALIHIQDGDPAAMLSSDTNPEISKCLFIHANRHVNRSLPSSRIRKPWDNALPSRNHLVSGCHTILCASLGSYIIKSERATDVMFQLPVCIALTICATRMHRGLYEHANPTSVHSVKFKTMSYVTDNASDADEADCSLPTFHRTLHGDHVCLLFIRDWSA